LDDAREAPVGWGRTHNAEETIAKLKTGSVVALDLDHYLGADAEDSGDDVLRWLEEEVRTKGFRPPDSISVHTGDLEARVKMDQAIKKIHELWRAQGHRE
jgi:hypothetical protein